MTTIKKRTEVDPGHVICPDCLGRRACFNCHGKGTVDGALCDYCAGGKICRTCDGAGQIRETPIC